MKYKIGDSLIYRLPYTAQPEAGIVILAVAAKDTLDNPYLGHLGHLAVAFMHKSDVPKYLVLRPDDRYLVYYENGSMMLDDKNDFSHGLKVLWEPATQDIPGLMQAWRKYVTSTEIPAILNPESLQKGLSENQYDVTPYTPENWPDHAPGYSTGAGWEWQKAAVRQQLDFLILINYYTQRGGRLALTIAERLHDIMRKELFK